MPPPRKAPRTKSSPPQPPIFKFAQSAQQVDFAGVHVGILPAAGGRLPVRAGLVGGVKLRRRFPEVLFGEIEGIGEPAARFLDTGLVARFG